MFFIMFFIMFLHNVFHNVFHNVQPLLPLTPQKEGSKDTRRIQRSHGTSNIIIKRQPKRTLSTEPTSRSAHGRQVQPVISTQEAPRSARHRQHNNPRTAQETPRKDQENLKEAIFVVAKPQFAAFAGRFAHAAWWRAGLTRNRQRKK